MVLSALANKVTNKFKAFCKTELMDRFLHSCIEYFQAFFDLKKALAEVADEAAKTKSEKRENPAAEAAASAVAVELEGVARARMSDVAGLYAAILVQHSNYANTQQDRQFFETLYDFAARVLFTLYDRKLWHAIENELGRIFRSEHFNLSLRKNEQSNTKPRRCKELYAMRRGLDPMQRSALEQTHRYSIHNAMNLRSPIIATIFPTAKQRMQQAAELQQSLQGGETLPTHAATATSSSGSAHDVPAAQPTRPGAAPSPLHGRTSEEMMDEEIGAAYATFSGR